MARRVRHSLLYCKVGDPAGGFWCIRAVLSGEEGRGQAPSIPKGEFLVRRRRHQRPRSGSSKRKILD